MKTRRPFLVLLLVICLTVPMLLPVTASAGWHYVGTTCTPYWVWVNHCCDGCYTPYCYYWYCWPDYPELTVEDQIAQKATETYRYAKDYLRKLKKTLATCDWKIRYQLAGHNKTENSVWFVTFVRGDRSVRLIFSMRTGSDHVGQLRPYFFKEYDFTVGKQDCKNIVAECHDGIEPLLAYLEWYQ